MRVLLGSLLLISFVAEDTGRVSGVLRLILHPLDLLLLLADLLNLRNLAAKELVLVPELRERASNGCNELVLHLLLLEALVGLLIVRWGIDSFFVLGVRPEGLPLVPF